ncbi:MAG: hydroxyneurosporene methyltransferase [SAR202 cluster bacterium]|nr:hydroxyneurosporene methyltransferase [SAR202 cluster bacterium]
MDLIFGRWRSQVLYAGVKLGIFDAVSNGHREAASVAQQAGLDPALCYRLMRALASLDLLREDGKKGFSLTEAGSLLRKDSPQTMRGVTLLEEGPHHYALWKHLPEMVRDGKQNAFVREFGRMAFDHAASDREYAGVFNDAMSSYSSAQTAWALEMLGGFDFSKVKHVCDVGGGQGHLLCSILAKHSHLKGTVFDLPSVVENKSLLWAERLGVGSRCTYTGGDMFATIPKADVYFMKMILHDWNDEECIQILRNIAGAAPAGGRLFVVEHIVPGPDTPHFAKLFDIHMMCWGTGRERTAGEYVALMEKGGWRYERTRHPREGLMGAVEGVRA